MDEEHLTYRLLVSGPEIIKMYKQIWNRIDSVPILNVDALYTDTVIQSETDKWPTLIRFPEDIFTLPEPILYFVGVDWNYFQEGILEDGVPNIDVDVTEIRWPGIVPFHDPYGYNVRLETSEDIYALEQHKNGGHYYLTSLYHQYNGPLIPLRDTNLYPVHKESYGACFTNKYIADAYANSVKAFISQDKKWKLAKYLT